MKADELLALIKEVLEEGFAILSDEIGPDLARAFHERGIEVGTQIGLTAKVRGVVDREAVNYARARGAELLKDFAETTPEMLRATLAQSIEEGWSVGRLRDTLRDNYAFSPTRALSIARTETAIARRVGGRISAVAAGAQSKHWEITDDACPLCMSNLAAGWISIDDEFPEGDNPHPNCACDLIFRVDPADADAE